MVGREYRYSARKKGGVKRVQIQEGNPGDRTRNPKSRRQE